MAERFESVLVQFERRQHHHPHAAQQRIGRDLSEQSESVEHRHPDVAEHHVRCGPAQQGQPLAPVAGPADQLKVVLGRDQRGQTQGGPANIGGSYLTPPSTCRSPEVAFAFISELSPANEGLYYSRGSC